MYEGFAIERIYSQIRPFALLNWQRLNIEVVGRFQLLERGKVDLGHRRADEVSPEGPLGTVEHEVVNDLAQVWIRKPGKRNMQLPHLLEHSRKHPGVTLVQPFKHQDERIPIVSPHPVKPGG